MRRTKELAIIFIIILVVTYLAFATVSSQTTKVYFPCNGSTTTFSCTGGNKIPCFASTDIEVYIRTDSTGVDDRLTLTTDYSVSALNNDYTNGFTVTTVQTYASGKTLVVKRAIGLTQEVNLIRGRAIPAEPMEKTLDRQMLALQDSKEELGRSLRIPVTDSAYDMNLPSSIDRANKYMAFGATGDPTVADGTTSDIVVSSWGETLVDDATAAKARETLLLTDYTASLGLLDLITKGPWADVRAFGAIGNGVDDDTTAIQTAITSLMSTGGALVFPNGTYKITDRITGSLSAGKILLFMGLPHATIVGDTIAEPSGSTELGMIQIAGTVTSDVYIKNIKITHGASALDYLAGIYLTTGFNNVILDNVTVTGASRTGIRIDQANSVRVENCHCDNNRYAGLSLDDCNNVVVDGGSFNDNGTTAPDDGYGVTCRTSVTGYCQSVLITGVTANDNKRKGIDVHAGHNVVISNNTVKGFEKAGIYAVNSSTSKDTKNIKIIDNFVDGDGASNVIVGIEAGSYSADSIASETFVIRGNTIKNCDDIAGSVCIQVRSSDGVCPRQVVISENMVINGVHATNGYIIYVPSYANPIENVIVSNNILHSVSAVMGIYVRGSTNVNIIGNIIKVDSGTVTYGIHVETGTHATIIGNQLHGNATYTTPIHVYDLVYQITRANIHKDTVIDDEVIIKGWVTFDGTDADPDSTKAGYNVSSITDNGTGNYSINWDIDFADTNYCVVISSSQIHTTIHAKTTAITTVKTYDSASNAADAIIVCVEAVR